MRKKGHIERDIPDNSHSVFFDPKAQGKKGSGTVIDKIGKSGSGNMVNIFLDKVSIDSIHREGAGDITNIILSGEYAINHISRSYYSSGTTKNISIDTATPEQLRLVVRELSRALQALAKGLKYPLSCGKTVVRLIQMTLIQMTLVLIMAQLESVWINTRASTSCIPFINATPLF